MLEGGLFVLFIVVAVLAGAIVGFVLKQVFTAKEIKASKKSGGAYCRGIQERSRDT